MMKGKRFYIVLALVVLAVAALDVTYFSQLAVAEAPPEETEQATVVEPVDRFGGPNQSRQRIFLETNLYFFLLLTRIIRRVSYGRLSVSGSSPTTQAVQHAGSHFRRCQAARHKRPPSSNNPVSPVSQINPA